MTSAPTVASWISPKAHKGDPSGIAGRGLFAVEPIGAGEVVAVKGGHLVDTAALHALPERLQNSEIQIAEGLHLVALVDDEYEPVMLFINHSCEPNVGFAGNVVLAAMRDVAPGEELTTDYALFDASATTPMPCSCGTPSCRGTIGGDDWRLPALRARHAGWFSRYLADRHDRLRTYEVEAFNTATASSNKIHDDDVARRFGFSGGLVPGVDVYAYLCHLPAEEWGERWLAAGTITARFRSPVYDGDRVTVTGAPDGGGLDLELRDPSGRVCAVGRATLAESTGEAGVAEAAGAGGSGSGNGGDGNGTGSDAGTGAGDGGVGGTGTGRGTGTGSGGVASSGGVTGGVAGSGTCAGGDNGGTGTGSGTGTGRGTGSGVGGNGGGGGDLIDVDAWPAGPPPDPDDRPPVASDVLRSAELGAVAATFRAEPAGVYLDDVREDLPLFRTRHLAHPGWLLRFANSILVANVELGPWIHTESTVRLLGLVHDGDRVETRARVSGVREQSGHEVVDLDVVQHVDGRPVARITHTAIFRLRDDR